MPTPRHRLTVRLLALLAASLAFAVAPTGSGAVTGLTPLMDMGSSTYLGFEGGLYEGGSNQVPADHAAAGSARAAAVQPLDAGGNPSASGKIVLLSIGHSSTSQDWCSEGPPPCDPYSLMGQAETSASVNHATMTVVNGAIGGQGAAGWDAPTESNYDLVRDLRLIPAGVTEQQVQAVWLKTASLWPTVSLPSGSAEAYALEAFMGDIVRALKARYPHLQLVFVSSRMYAGYATTNHNPEPYAYEYGFSVKWLIQAQIDQMRNGGVVVDARAGDLDLATGAPWVAWGPYLWADGSTPRSDGLTWLPEDFVFGDGIHSSPSGRTKVANMLMTFFLDSPFSQCWFGVTCGSGLDTDDDGYPDALEASLGRASNIYCATMRADVDGDRVVSILDLSRVAMKFGQPVPPAPWRYDQGLPPRDDSINILDLSSMAQTYLQSVSACP